MSKNKKIIAILFVILAVIVAVIIYTFKSTEPDQVFRGETDNWKAEYEIFKGDTADTSYILAEVKYKNFKSNSIDYDMTFEQPSGSNGRKDTLNKNEKLDLKMQLYCEDTDYKKVKNYKILIKWTENNETKTETLILDKVK